MFLPLYFAPEIVSVLELQFHLKSRGCELRPQEHMDILRRENEVLR